ncbi:hypothetical protein Ppa06_50490 [Planomonospora parontospora subsp. parontospora]|uniref:Uncharacterized protein n=2 Tax=Planomonospora parontospora TaxID=58119 RepID=A0AA37F5Y7_9ACTN|nr:hypothetical protein GCM10010126_43880 [Planomonospora parontospora]GII11251.1 hypothetical protein Ppa06_50490 [Planomonospora parontospora subsp. parontospora]
MVIPSVRQAKDPGGGVTSRPRIRVGTGRPRRETFTSGNVHGRTGNGHERIVQSKRDLREFMV